MSYLELIWTKSRYHIFNCSPLNIFSHVLLVWTYHVTKTGDFPQFLKLHVLQKIFGWKYAWIFVLGHYLSFKAQSYSSYALLENCLFHQILDNVYGKHRRIFFKPNLGYCLLTVNFGVFCVIIHILHVKICLTTELNKCASNATGVKEGFLKIHGTLTILLSIAWFK